MNTATSIQCEFARPALKNSEMPPKMLANAAFSTVPFEQKHRYLVGRENLVDVLTLSKTQHILFGVSNIPYTAMFLSPKKIPHSIIDNGMRGGVIKSLFSFKAKSILPSYLGGFKNHIITKNKLIKSEKSDFEIL